MAKQINRTLPKGRAKEQAGVSSHAKWFLFLSVFVAFCVFVYSALHNGLTNWDDDRYIAENPAIQSWNFIGIFTTRVVSNWAPAHMFLLMLEYHLFKFNPVGYHLTSLLLHLCNVVLTYLVVFKLTRKQLIAGTVALFFGIHPMHVESVAWVSDQKDLLYFLFYLAGILTYLKSGEQGAIRWFKNKYLLLTMVFFILSCLAKGMAVTFPISLILIDCYRANNWNWKFIERNFIRKLPFIIISVEFGVAAIIAQKNGGALAPLGHTTAEQLMFACYGLMTYLVKFIAPFSLSIVHSYPLKDSTGSYPLIYYISPVAVFGVVAFFTTLIFWRVKKGQSNNTLLFGLLFFMVNIILVLQLKSVGHSIMAERYSYLSYLGLLFLAGASFNSLWEKYRYRSPKIMLAGYFSLALLFGFISYQYTDSWLNSITLWTRVIDGFPAGAAMDFAPNAYTNRADANVKQHEYDLAIADCNQAIAAKPDYFLAYNDRADAYINQGKYDLAIADCSKAIAIKPDFILAYNNRGYAYVKENKLDSSLADYNAAIKLNPAYFEVYNNRAMAYSTEGKFDSAIADCNKSLAIKPNYYDAYNNRGAAYAQQGKLDSAIADWSKAINLNPNYSKAYLNRAIAYRQKGEQTEAEMDFEEARRLGWSGSK